jgi:NADH:ubiquinone reductase (H+-translocating)
VVCQEYFVGYCGRAKNPFHYLDKGIIAMIGRNSAVAKVGERRHELQGAIAFAAWLGVHAALLCSTRAKIEALWNGGRDYFGGARGDTVLDRTEDLQIDWNEAGEEPASASTESSHTDSAQ